MATFERAKKYSFADVKHFDIQYRKNIFIWLSLSANYFLGQNFIWLLSKLKDKQCQGVLKWLNGRRVFKWQKKNHIFIWIFFAISSFAIIDEIFSDLLSHIIRNKKNCFHAIMLFHPQLHGSNVKGNQYRTTTILHIICALQILPL